MANEINAGTNLLAAREEAISEVVQEIIQDRAKLLPLVTDYSGLAKPGQKSVDILYRDPYGRPATKADNTPVTHTAMTFSADTLTFNPYYVSSKIEDFAKLQSVVDVTPQVVEAIGSAMAREVDEIILDAMQEGVLGAHQFDFADSGTASAGASELTFAEIITARKLLQENGKLDMDGSQWMIVSPNQEQVLLNLASVQEASYFGLSSPIQQGQVPRLFGFNLMVHNLLGDEEVIFLDKSAVGFAAQQDYKIEFQRDLENIADHYVGTGVMAAKQLSGGKRIVRIIGA
jgi:hypothetical protein